MSSGIYAFNGAILFRMTIHLQKAIPRFWKRTFYGIAELAGDEGKKSIEMIGMMKAVMMLQASENCSTFGDKFSSGHFSN